MLSTKFLADFAGGVAAMIRSALCAQKPVSVFIVLAVVLTPARKAACRAPLDLPNLDASLLNFRDDMLRQAEHLVYSCTGRETPQGNVHRRVAELHLGRLPEHEWHLAIC